MKLLKLFGNRKSSVSVLDATSHHGDDDRNLAGLRRSNAAITHYDGNYQNGETKTFEVNIFFIIFILIKPFLFGYNSGLPLYLETWNLTI